MSEHTDAARLEATRDAIRTGTAPRPRVEGEAGLVTAAEYASRDPFAVPMSGAVWNTLAYYETEVARLTAEVERLREIADDALLQAEMFDEHDPTVQSIRARLAALALPTPAPEATNDGK